MSTNPGSVRNQKKKKILNKLVRRQLHRCWICGERFVGTGERAATIDHLITKSEGGKDRSSNYRAVHRSCNQQRGSQPLHSVLTNTRIKS